MMFSKPGDWHPIPGMSELSTNQVGRILFCKVWTPDILTGG